MNKEDFTRGVHGYIRHVFGKDTPPMVYHYTTANALISILEHKELWLTRSEFLNDPQEMDYGIQVIEKALDNYVEKELFDMVLAYVGIIHTRPKFVLSLSTAPDSLMLWSHYAKSDGYAIGFDTEELVKQFGFFDETSGLLSVTHFGEVIYDESAQMKDIYLFISTILEMLRELDEPDEGILRWLASEIATGLISKSLMYKDYAFHPEQEYRFVCMQFVEQSQPSPIFFRDSQGVIIPYVKLALDSAYKDIGIPLYQRTERINCISEIRVGPGHTSDNVILGVESLLKERNLESVTVTPSAFRIR